MNALIIGMEAEDQFSLQQYATVTFVLYIAFCLLLVFLFWEQEIDSGLVFTILIVCVALIGILLLYVLQCYQSKKFTNFNWHRTVEYTPFVFFYVFTLCIIFVCFLVVIHSNGLTFTQSFAHIDLISWWVLVAIFFIWFICMVMAINASYIHRNNSVVKIDGRDLDVNSFQ